MRINTTSYKALLGNYLLKFIGTFCLLYFGTKAFIGLSTPGNYYLPFMHNYLDYIGILRSSILLGAKWILLLFGYHCNVVNTFFLKMQMGRSVHIVYSCLGYGVMSFWLAFIFANTGSLKRKVLWMVAGVLIIWVINVIRIALLLLSINNNWTLFFGIDHHTLFNITSYIFIFIGIYCYDKSYTKTIEGVA